MKQWISEEKGFSLVEILIAVMILSIGLLALAGMQISSMHGNAFSGTTTDVVNIAQDRIEQLTELGYDDAALTAGNYSETQGRYTVSWTITDNTMATNTKTIDVTVSWDQSGQSKTFQAQHVRADTE